MNVITDQVPRMSVQAHNHLGLNVGKVLRFNYVVWPTVIYLIVALLFTTISTISAWPLPEVAFKSDNSPLSWLSSAQLWTLSVLAMRLASERTLTLPLGMWFSIAMAGMAFDEQFMFHERWKFGCIDWVEICRYHWATEIPMLLIGAGGLMTAVWLHRSLPKGLAQAQMWLAICIGIFALGLDLIGAPVNLSPYEEGFEVLAEAVFVGLFLGLVAKQQVISHALENGVIK